jgi:hypothetical protein
MKIKERDPDSGEIKEEYTEVSATETVETLKLALKQVSEENQSFMDYYFSINPE